MYFLSVIMGILGGQEIILILIIVLVLFGGRKIPELMRGLGRGVSEYKKAKNEVFDDVNEDTDTSSSSAKREQGKKE